jgi:hypothetical protein
MRYAIYGGPNGLNRLIARSLTRIPGCEPQVFASGLLLQQALAAGPKIDSVLLTGPGTDLEVPTLVQWLQTRPADRVPRLVAWQHENAAIDEQAADVQLNNVTLSEWAPAAREKKVGRAPVQTERTPSSISSTSGEAPQRVFGRYVFRETSGGMLLDCQFIPLPGKLYKLAWFLFQHMNQVVSREDLYRQIWGDGSSTASRSLDTHIARLRTKLQLGPGNPYVLSAMYGQGYALKEEKPD